MTSQNTSQVRSQVRQVQGVAEGIADAIANGSQSGESCNNRHYQQLVGHLAYPTNRDALTPGARISGPSHAAMQSASTGGWL